MSRPVLSRLAHRYEDRLTGELSARDRSDEVVDQIRSMIQVTSTEEGLITVTVECTSASLSADIANELFAECEKASKSIERQLILQQASHLDQALESSVGRLRETEVAMGAFAEAFGLVDLNQQTSNGLRSVRELSTEIDQVVTDLAELSLSHSAKSPEVQRLLARKAALEGQLAANQSGIVGSVGTAQFGEMMVRYESLRQKIRFERDLVATLSTKADIYRLRAEQPTGNLAVIREAVMPDRPSGPSKKRELGLILGLSIFLGTGWSIAVWQLNRIMGNTLLAGRVRSLLAQLSPRLIRFIPKNGAPTNRKGAHA
jgi:capsule polysaccharide export protein KpsE/RkpR